MNFSIAEYNHRSVMPELEGGGRGGHWSPKYLANQFTLFQAGDGRLCPKITSGPPNISLTEIIHFRIIFCLQILCYNGNERLLSICHMDAYLILCTAIEFLEYDKVDCKFQLNHFLSILSSQDRSFCRHI